ncbi:hypothetical protein [Sphingomonas sp. ACRSK]|nr:hypothetical protein [Sphingomonas sp. ACRSK]
MSWMEARRARKLARVHRTLAAIRAAWNLLVKVNLARRPMRTPS